MPEPVGSSIVRPETYMTWDDGHYPVPQLRTNRVTDVDAKDKRLPRLSESCQFSSIYHPPFKYYTGAELTPDQFMFI